MKFGSLSAADLGHEIEAVVGDRGLDRGVLGAPFRQEPVEADRIDHRARENVRADLGALLDHHHAGLGRQLLETNGGREPRGPRTDDDDVELHRFAGGHLVGHGALAAFVLAGAVLLDFLNNMIACAGGLRAGAMGNSHYLEKDRLANLIAAIQIMAVADRPSGTLNRWVAELEASEELTPEQLDKSPDQVCRTQEMADGLRAAPGILQDLYAAGRAARAAALALRRDAQKRSKRQKSVGRARRRQGRRGRACRRASRSPPTRFRC